MISDVGVNAPLDFFDGVVVCYPFGLAVLAGCVVGITDFEDVWVSSHGNIPVCCWGWGQKYLYM